MKYFNGNIWVNGRQYSGFVCAKTKKRAIELSGVSPYYFNIYWSDTGNNFMKKVAKDKEGAWIEIGSFSNKYRKLKR